MGDLPVVLMRSDSAAPVFTPSLAARTERRPLLAPIRVNPAKCARHFYRVYVAMVLFDHLHRCAHLFCQEGHPDALCQTLRRACVAEARDRESSTPQDGVSGSNQLSSGG
jgi:hypothetical protein